MKSLNSSDRRFSGWTNGSYDSWKFKSSFFVIFYLSSGLPFSQPSLSGTAAIWAKPIWWAHRYVAWSHSPPTGNQLKNTAFLIPGPGSARDLALTTPVFQGFILGTPKFQATSRILLRGSSQVYWWALVVSWSTRHSMVWDGREDLQTYRLKLLLFFFYK